MWFGAVQCSGALQAIVAADKYAKSFHLLQQFGMGVSDGVHAAPILQSLGACRRLQFSTFAFSAGSAVVSCGLSTRCNKLASDLRPTVAM